MSRPANLPSGGKLPGKRNKLKTWEWRTNLERAPEIADPLQHLHWQQTPGSRIFRIIWVDDIHLWCLFSWAVSTLQQAKKLNIQQYGERSVHSTYKGHQFPVMAKWVNTPPPLLSFRLHTHCSTTRHLTTPWVLSCQNAGYEGMSDIILWQPYVTPERVSGVSLLARRVALTGNKTQFSFHCPLLLIIKMEFAHQSNPCCRTSLRSLIYDYLHVQND